MGSIGYVKILRYYGTKALRSNCRISKSDLQYVILNCLRQDNTLNIGGTYHVILNLFQDLKNKVKPLSLNPSPLRCEGKVGGHYYADRKYTKTIDTIDKTNYNSNMMNYKSEILKQVQDDKLVSEAHRNHKPHYTHLTHFIHSKKAAFTLAEVLITLGIIGIVAAMTIPTLISNYQKKVLKTQFTQTYSLISQAIGLMKANTEAMNLYDYYLVYDSMLGYYREDELISEFTKYVKLQHSEGKEFPEYKTYDGSKKYESDASSYWISLPDMVLGNGAYLTIYPTGNLYGRVLTFVTDINGAKGPNRAGFDLFVFEIQKSDDVLHPRKMRQLYSEDELENNNYPGLAGYPCSIKSKQSANGIGCAWYAMHDVCPDDDTKGYWESLPN